MEARRSEIERLGRKGAKATAIYDWLRLNEEDYTGSLSAVKRLCARLDREAGTSPQDVAIPVETAPGEVAQVDFVYARLIYSCAPRIRDAPQQPEPRRSLPAVQIHSVR